MIESLPDPVKVQLLSREQWHAALQSVLQSRPAEQGQAIADRFLSAADGTSAEQARLLVATQEATIVGVTLARLQPGGTALVWAPVVSGDKPHSTAASLVIAATAESQRSGARLVQALLEVETEAEVAPFLTAGFERTAELLYLVSIESAFPHTLPAAMLQFEPYSPDRHNRLADIVDRTYEGTLDCPQLNGVRDTHDADRAGRES